MPFIYMMHYIILYPLMHFKKCGSDSKLSGLGNFDLESFVEMRSSLVALAAQIHWNCLSRETNRDSKFQQISNNE